MSLLGAVVSDRSTDVLRTLRSVCATRGLDDLGGRLGRLSELVRWDMKEVAEALDALPSSGSNVQRAAHHLLEQGGKRLRPMCVVLAHRVGTPQGPLSADVRGLAVAVELVHAATLLHDDVVDLGDVRRGAPAARRLFGNAASIFAGDWLLVDALRRVREARVEGTLDRLLDIIEEMIEAESIQLARRVPERDASTGAQTVAPPMTVDDYFRVVRGKTAALFRWATWAGAKAGGLGTEGAEKVERYGLHLGIAFQLVDDLLDYAGDFEKTGKALFTDLREGKMTYPLLFARDADAEAAALLERLLEEGAPAGTPAGVARRTLELALLERMRQCGALDETRTLASEHALAAVRSLEDLPDAPAREALHTVALATVERER